MDLRTQHQKTSWRAGNPFGALEVESEGEDTLEEEARSPSPEPARACEVRAPGVGRWAPQKGRGESDQTSAANTAGAVGAVGTRRGSAAARPPELNDTQQALLMVLRDIRVCQGLYREAGRVDFSSEDPGVFGLAHRVRQLANEAVPKHDALLLEKTRLDALLTGSERERVYETAAERYSPPG